MVRGAGSVRKRVRVSPQTAHREMSGETVLLNLETGAIYTLKDSACRVWQVLMTDGDLDVATATLTNEFDADASVVERDVLRFVEDLVGHGFLVLESEPA